MSGTWLVGSTVRILLVVTDPANGALVDPTTVTFLSLTHDGATVVTGTVTATRISQGSYEIRLDTAGYQPGAYTWLVRLVDDLDSVALVRDQFVLGAV
jgi:hypothetical protein